MHTTSDVNASARLSVAVRCTRFFVMLLLAGLALGMGASAQQTGTVDGIVRDNTGALVPGATVKLINEQSKS